VVEAIACGYERFEDLVTGRARSLVRIAKAGRVAKRYVGRLLPLALPAPGIIASVLAGTQAVGLAIEKPTRRVDLPLARETQSSLLGVD